MIKTDNIFIDVPTKLEAEQFTDLVREGRMRITRIISTGHTTDWQEPEDEEWVMVLKGSSALRFKEGDRRLIMRPGDWCHIPAGCRHRVEETSDKEPTVWLAVHYKASAPASV